MLIGNYYKHFEVFVPKLKKMYFKAKVKNDISAILDIKENIWNNWNLTKNQKKEVLQKIGLVE